MSESHVRISGDRGTALNESKFKVIQGSVCAPQGFRAGAVFCGIKTLGTGKGSDKGAKPDLAIIVSDRPAAVAGTFTTNRVCAAPVKWSARIAAKNSARAIVVNSGNANACTGRQGMRDAERMARSVAAALCDAGNPACKQMRTQTGLSASRSNRIRPNEIFVCSTGRIGVPMPMQNVERGIRECATLLSRSAQKARQTAEAIMTSDTRRKEIAVEIRLKDKAVRIGGICKGAGMIQPRMDVATVLRRRVSAPRHSGAATGHATMLGFVTCDAAISPGLLKSALAEAVEQSFNRISVDGDMSTNDSVIALANGLSGNVRITNRDRSFREFQAALTFVCLELAKMIVRDGEGVSRFVTVHVRNARSRAEAEVVARSVINSSLVRTSWCGGDPNWGRVLCAIGYSGVSVDEKRISIGYCASKNGSIKFAFRRGAPTDVAFRALTKITGAPEFDVHIDLGRGASRFTMYASDLTEEYVTFNKGDIRDPASLGG